MKKTILNVCALAVRPHIKIAGREGGYELKKSQRVHNFNVKAQDLSKKTGG